MNDRMREIVAMLAAAKLENRRLQESMVPELTLAAVDALLREQLPYSWMASLIAALRQHAAADTSGQWSKDLLAVSIWRVVNEEFRTSARFLRFVTCAIYPQTYLHVAKSRFTLNCRDYCSYSF